MIPDVVIKTINELIVKNWNGDSAFVGQRSIEKELSAAGLKRSDIFDNKWLNIEDIYRGAGWEVFYDKPGYNESYEPRFGFREGSKK
jgi:hypothetical protein